MSSLTKPMKSLIRNLWNQFWSGGIANPLTAMEQISYFLYMRKLHTLDEEERIKSNFSGEEYVSIFKDSENCRWDYFKHLEGSKMLDHVGNVVFPWMISNLSAKGDVFAEAMKEAVFIISKPSLIVEVVTTIDSIYALIDEEVSNTGQRFYDIQGDIYEEFLSEIATAGKNGQFRTPRHIIQMMATMIQPKLGERICDPAAGTGGFILGAYQQILADNTSDNLLLTDRFGFSHGTLGDKITNEKHWTFLENESFFAYDFDRTMIRLGIMNLISHGLENPRFIRQDTMSRTYNEFNKYDVVLANPPFKGSLDVGDIWDESMLSTTRTELLFVDRIIQLLKTGGRAAVIVPDGVLSSFQSKAHGALRKSLIEDHGLKAVISLPSGVFKPYAGVSTGILFFTKEEKTERVWFYDMKADGFSLDDMREEIEQCDIPDILQKWKEIDTNIEDDRSTNSFFIDKKEIVENDYNLSLTKYREMNYEEELFDPPLEIISRLKEIESSILSDLTKLEEYYSDLKNGN